MIGMDPQAAEETTAALDKEILRLEKLDSEVRQLRAEKGIWEQERADLKWLAMLRSWQTFERTATMGSRPYSLATRKGGSRG